MNTGPFDVSVIIPVYNRGELIRYTLESVRRASAGLRVETIVVDDGSANPIAEDLRPMGYSVDQIIRQDNQGLLFARLRGLRAAHGRTVQFLDSDDLVSPEKFRLQLAALDKTNAAVSSTGTARSVLGGPYEDLSIRPDPEPVAPVDTTRFFLETQPAPHVPLFRSDYLLDLVGTPLFPASARYNCVAEIWFYHIAATRPDRVAHVPGPHAVLGVHAGSRLTGQWERLGIASLEVMEAFTRACPPTAETLSARTLVGEAAFNSWRRLPRGFDAGIQARLLAVWQQSPPGRLRKLGGPLFSFLARLLGPTGTGRLLRLRNAPYSKIRTLSDAELRSLLQVPSLKEASPTALNS